MCIPVSLLKEIDKSLMQLSVSFVLIGKGLKVMGVNLYLTYLFFSFPEKYSLLGVGKSRKGPIFKFYEVGIIF